MAPFSSSGRGPQSTTGDIEATTLIIRDAIANHQLHLPQPCNYAARVQTRAIKLTFARGRFAAPKSAWLACSALRADQHVSVGTDVVYAGSYGPFHPYYRRVRGFLWATAGGWSWNHTATKERSDILTVKTTFVVRYARIGPHSLL